MIKINVIFLALCLFYVFLEFIMAQGGFYEGNLIFKETYEERDYR